MGLEFFCCSAIWAVDWWSGWWKKSTRNPPTCIQGVVSFGGNSWKGFKSDTAAVLHLPCQLKRTKLA